MAYFSEQRSLPGYGFSGTATQGTVPGLALPPPSSQALSSPLQPTGPAQRAISVRAGTYSELLASASNPSVAIVDLVSDIVASAGGLSISVVTGSNLTVRGACAARPCVIDLNGLGRAFRVDGGALSLANLTIRNAVSLQGSAVLAVGAGLALKARFQRLEAPPRGAAAPAEALPCPEKLLLPRPALRARTQTPKSPDHDFSGGSSSVLATDVQFTGNTAWCARALPACQLSACVPDHM